MRRSQAILIDGGRGAGKTSLMLRSLDRWKRALVGADGSARDELRLEPFVGSGSRCIPERALVIPLGVVDLQPLPPDMNLAMVLVSRLRKVMDALQDERVQGTSRGPRGLTRTANAIAADDLHDAWQDLAHSIGSYSGHLQSRARSMDLDAYIEELTVDTRSGLSIDRTLRRFVDVLCTVVSDTLTKGRRPMFVLPIDDADMNPRKGPQVIELIRTFYHPRLCYLLTGDTRMFLRTLMHHFAEAIRGGSAVEAGDTAEASHLAREVYDRVIPPGNRCTLHAPDVTQRLDFKVEGVALRERLDDIKIEWLHPRSLAWLMAPDWLGGVSRARFNALLPERLRPLVDLHDWLELGSGTQNALEVAIHLYRDALSRSELSKRARARMEEVVHETPYGETLIWTDALRLPVHTARQQQPYQGNDASAIVEAIWRFEGSVTVDGGEDRTRETLDDRIIEALRLLVDVASGEPVRASAGGDLVQRTRVVSRRPLLTDAPPLIVTQSESPLSGLRFRWPLPRWSTYLDAELFSAALALPKGPADRAQHIGQLAQAYFFELLSLACLRRDDPGDALWGWKVVGDLAFDLLQPHGMKSMGDENPRALEFQRWIRHALIVFAPEFGLPTAESRAGIAALGWIITTDAQRQELSRRREDAIGIAIGKDSRGDDVSRAVKAFNQRDPNHPWHAFVRPVSPSSPPPPRRAAQPEDAVTTVSAPAVERRLSKHFEESRLLFLRELPATVEGYLARLVAMNVVQATELDSLESHLAELRVVAWSRAELFQALRAPAKARDHLVARADGSLTVRVETMPVRETVHGLRIGLQPQKSRGYAGTALRVVLHDLAADAVGIAGRDDGTAPFPLWWPSSILPATTLRDGSERTPRLLAPPFTAIYDRTLAIDGWNAQRFTAATATATYLRLLLHVFEIREAPDAFTDSETPDIILRRLAHRLKSDESRRDDPRWALYQQFLKRLACFAAPEFGLDRGFAAELIACLEGVTDRDAVCALRARAWSDDSAEGARIAAEIDALRAGDPFARIFSPG